MDEIRKSVKDIEGAELWSNVEEIRNATKTIESSLSDLSTRFNECLEQTNDRFNHQENKIKDLDKRLDDKLSIFTETMEKDFSKKIGKVNTSTNDRLFNLKQQINTCSERIADFATKDTTSTDSNDELCTKVNELAEMVEKIDIDDLKNDLTKLSDEINIDLASLSVLERNVAKLQKESEDNDKEIFAKLQLLFGQSKQQHQIITNQSSKINTVIQNMEHRQIDVEYSAIIAQTKSNDVQLRQNEDTPVPSSNISTLVQNSEQCQSGIEHPSASSRTDMDDKEESENEAPEPGIEHPAASSRTDTDDKEESENKAPDPEHKVENRNSTESTTPIKDELTELLFFIDSNARYLNFRQLKSFVVVPCLMYTIV